ncbi:MAG: rod shape-determining protein RodA [Solirubrobacterales bacterium]|nr:rod shape-determining protein RodA [Solirubrobacterales bacterium]MBV9536390.1 rod shape-determining protein RodA [Solirubrobacterales bacterium]
MNMTAIQVTHEQAPQRLRVLRRSDPLLFISALGLVACSLVTLRTATAGSGSYYVERQGIYAAAGLLVALLLSRIDYTRLRQFKYVFYGLMIVTNLIVLGMPAVQGGHRWIPLPGFQVQPSEFGKILLILSLSAFAVDRSQRVHERSTTARIMLLGLIPALLVIVQPDIGTSIVYAAVAFVTLFILGTSWKHLLALVLLALAAIAIVLVGAPALGVHVLSPYQVQRLTGFLHPSQNPQSATWNIHQSLIAVGSGGKLGRGSIGATQTRLGYLPAPSTDFVFSALGETYGFVGGAVVLSLYALLIWRGLRVVALSKNLYGSLIAGTIVAMFMVQVFVNVGMTIGIMPITGIPLPLVSYGGSSVIVTLIAVGLLESIHIQARIAADSKSRSLVS